MTRLRLILVCCFLGSSCTTFDRGPKIEIIDKRTGRLTELNLSPRGREAQSQCVRALQILRPQLISASSYLTDAQKSSTIWHKKLTLAKASDCELFESRGDILNIFSTVLEFHSGRIGMILPLSATNEAVYATIINELKTTLKKFGVKEVDDRLIVRRLSKESKDIERAAAEMVFIDRVSSIVVVNPHHFTQIKPIVENARIPLFVLNTRSEVSGTKQSFRVFPSASYAAKKLMAVYRQNQITQLLVLSPQDADSDLLNEIKRLSGKSISFSTFTFDASNSDDIVQKAKLAAEKMKLMNSRVHGVLILDNFKTVRQIVSVFRDVGSNTKIVFTGNQQWRSSALVDPPEEALEGGMFVDFIGSYKGIPSSIEAITPENEYFTSAASASEIDFKILGYRLGSIVSEILSRGWKRHEMAAELRQLSNHWDDYFTKGERTFSDRSESFWPVFLFRIQGDQIKLVPQGT